MPHTTACDRGVVALVEFVFSDETGAKRRPVVVLSTPWYSRGRQDVIVAAVTSQMGVIRPGDCEIQGWRRAGLLAPSLLTGILRTIRGSMIQRVLGRIDPADLRLYEGGLRQALGL